VNPFEPFAAAALRGERIRWTFQTTHSPWSFYLHVSRTVDPVSLALWTVIIGKQGEDRRAFLTEVREGAELAARLSDPLVALAVLGGA
jgi:hypothetical protein